MLGTRGLAGEPPGGTLTLAFALASQRPAFSEIILDRHMIVRHWGTEFLGNQSTPPDHHQTEPSNSFAISAQGTTLRFSTLFIKPPSEKRVAFLSQQH